MNDTFMKEKPVGPLLASMALPMVFSMLVNSLYNIVDSFFVAQISEQAMAALSLVYPVQNMINAVAIGFGIGINARVSYHLGAGDKKMADTAATHGFLLSVIHGFLMTVISIAVMPAFLRMYTQDETVIRMGLEYSTIVFLFSTVITISLFFEKLFQAVGRMKVSMIALLVGCISNIILDPFLIWGIGFFPKMGIQGAALATGIGQVLTIVVYMAFYILKPIPVRVTPKALKASKETDLSLYAIGVPAILNLALPSFLISFLNSVLAAYSDSYVVILGIYYKLQTFLYLPANGIIQGMRPLIGYNFGAREMKRVKKNFPADTGIQLCDHASWNHHLSPGLHTAYEPFHQHPGNHNSRFQSSQDHQRRFPCFRSLCYHLRCHGRPGKRHTIPRDLPFPLRHRYHASSLAFIPLPGPHRRMERLLDHRGVYCHSIRHSLPENPEKSIV